MRALSLLQRLPIWPRYALVGAVASLAVFAVLAWAWPWQPGRIGGLVFGTFAALLFVNAGLYPWRRRWRTRPLGTAQRWLQLHIYGSVIAMLFVLIHTGFRWPAGLMGWSLLTLSLWTTATGLLGVAVQGIVPRLIARRLTVEAIYERIPELMARLVAEADELMTGAPDVIARAYASEVRPTLGVPTAARRWLAGPDARAAAPLAGLRSFLSDADRSRVDDLEAIVRDHADLDAQLRLQGVLRGWLLLHVPPAILLLGLIATHVLAVVWH